MEQRFSQAESEAAEILKRIGIAATESEIRKLVRAYVKAQGITGPKRSHNTIAASTARVCIAKKRERRG